MPLAPPLPLPLPLPGGLLGVVENRFAKMAALATVLRCGDMCVPGVGEEVKV